MSKCVRLPTGSGPLSGLQPTEYIPADTLVSGNPQERGLSYYADQTGQLEFVYLLQGQIDVIDDEGGVESYRAGDSFVMPRGCRCTWDVKEPVRKLYVVLTATAYQD